MLQEDGKKSFQERFMEMGIIAVQVGCVLEVREQLINRESQLAGKFWGKEEE